MRKVANAKLNNITSVAEYGLPVTDGLYLVYYGLSEREAMPIVVMHIGETETKQQRFYVMDKYGMFCEDTSDWLENEYIYSWTRV